MSNWSRPKIKYSTVKQQKCEHLGPSQKVISESEMQLLFCRKQLLNSCDCNRVLDPYTLCDSGLSQIKADNCEGEIFGC